jgi:hypothetical protein
MASHRFSGQRLERGGISYSPGPIRDDGAPIRGVSSNTASGTGRAGPTRAPAGAPILDAHICMRKEPQ